MEINRASSDSSIIQIEPMLAFRKISKDSSKIGKLICWFTKSKTYHVEIVINDFWISAMPNPGIYANKLRSNINFEKWIVVKLPKKSITLSDYNTVIDYINKTLNHNNKYDIMGLFWNQVLGISIYNKKYFCSELAAHILEMFGYRKYFGEEPSQFNPGDLLNSYLSKEKQNQNIEAIIEHDIDEDFTNLRRYSILGRIHNLIDKIKRRFR